ncbi:DUF5993 family protein [Pseudomonas aeruginosa]|uniref:DUF5993 family protein n=1 Tax=Pseudomonas aeruginosa TaxID=287 RepID=UPI003CF4D25F
MIVLFLFYFIIGLQIIFKPNKTIILQFLFSLFLILISFNYHIHLVNLWINKFNGIFSGILRGY